MAEKLEDLNLPNAVVTRIIKECLPEGVSIAKESRTAMAKAASVFVLYITSAANAIAMGHNRKTINAQDVLQAVEDAEFDFLVEPLRETLEQFKKLQKEKKDAIAKRKLQKDGVKQSDTSVEEEMVEDKESILEITIDDD